MSETETYPIDFTKVPGVDPDTFRSAAAGMFVMQGPLIREVAIRTARQEVPDLPESRIDDIKCGEPLIDVFVELEVHGGVPRWARVAMTPGVEVPMEGFAPAGFTVATMFPRNSEPWPTAADAVREFLGAELLASARVRVRFRERGSLNEEDTWGDPDARPLGSDPAAGHFGHVIEE
ncbi:hypothetical protein [Actinoallomurus sp. NPDC052274]|uniref:hypothetical protein n=1 Tax=Actinoallomurus sp. NPDC052274 TaxID=3155420 RepID=UPI00343F41C6